MSQPFNPEIFYQTLSLIGALFVLFAYIGNQTKRMHSDSILYNVFNVLGSGLLAYVALFPLQLGFLLSEGVWFGVSIISLYKLLRKQKN